MANHFLDLGSRNGHLSSVRARVSVLRHSVGLVVARLVAAAVHRLETAPKTVPVRMPEELTAGPLDTSVADLLARLRSDRGCTGAGPRKHLACSAARELGARAAHTADVIAALEETVTVAARPPCVRRAAIDALSAWQPHHGRLALARMQAIVRRRREWEREPV